MKDQSMRVNNLFTYSSQSRKTLMELLVWDNKLSYLTDTKGHSVTHCFIRITALKNRNDLL